MSCVDRATGSGVTNDLGGSPGSMTSRTRALKALFQLVKVSITLVVCCEGGG